MIATENKKRYTSWGCEKIKMAKGAFHINFGQLNSLNCLKFAFISNDKAPFALWGSNDKDS